MRELILNRNVVFLKFSTVYRIYSFRSRLFQETFRACCVSSHSCLPEWQAPLSSDGKCGKGVVNFSTLTSYADPITSLIPSLRRRRPSGSRCCYDLSFLIGLDVNIDFLLSENHSDSLSCGESTMENSIFPVSCNYLLVGLRDVVWLGGCRRRHRHREDALWRAFLCCFGRCALSENCFSFSGGYLPTYHFCTVAIIRGWFIVTKAHCRN